MTEPLPPEQPLPFPRKPATGGSGPPENTPRLIFCIGGQRYAIDLTTTMTELRPAAAQLRHDAIQ